MMSVWLVVQNGRMDTCTYGRTESLRLDLANGILRDNVNNRTYKSIHPLSPADCVLISNAAQRMFRLDRSVEWAKTAITLLKQQSSDDEKISTTCFRLCDA